VADALGAIRTSLAEQLARLRGVPPSALPEPLLDIVVRREELPRGGAYVVRPADWEALRAEEGAAGRPVPWWARLWGSGRELAAALSVTPPARGSRVLELGCGLALPSVVAACAGAEVLATDGAPDAVAFAAHVLALNELGGAEAALVDWSAHGDALVERGPWDVVLASDVLYTGANVQAALTLVPRLLASGGELRLADPGRAGARDFLAAMRGAFTIRTERRDDVALHRLRRRGRA
jgi:predicted nicotinamide N-methyase